MKVRALIAVLVLASSACAGNVTAPTAADVRSGPSRDVTTDASVSADTLVRVEGARAGIFMGSGT